MFSVQAVIDLTYWIFDVHWFTDTQLLLVLAHNQCLLLDLDTNRIDQTACEQKCMLYSARIIDFNQAGSAAVAYWAML
jgi:hypothetical protein